MTIDLLHGIFFAFIGGILGNVIKLLDMLNKPTKDRATIDWIYWANFLVFPIVGVFLVYVHIYDGAQLTGWAAVNIGASAPLILKSLYGWSIKLPTGKRN
jgi:uncharacterized membrane protein